MSAPRSPLPSLPPLPLSPGDVQLCSPPERLHGAAAERVAATRLPEHLSCHGQPESDGLRRGQRPLLPGDLERGGRPEEVSQGRGSV